MLSESEASAFPTGYEKADSSAEFILSQTKGLIYDILTQSLMGEDEGEGDQQITPHPRIWSGASSNLLPRGEGKNECPDTDEGKPTSMHPATLFTYDGSYGIL
jgi:hypothetical protein